MNTDPAKLAAIHAELTAEVAKLAPTARRWPGAVTPSLDTVYRTSTSEVAPPSPAERQALGRMMRALANQVEAAGYRMTNGRLTPNALGTTDHLHRTVTIARDLQESRAVATLIHELAHIRLAHKARRMMGGNNIEMAETEAESVSYIVGRALGLRQLDFSAPYIASYTEGDMRYLAETKARVLRVAEMILADL